MNEAFGAILAAAASPLGIAVRTDCDGWLKILERQGTRRFVLGHVFDLNTAAAAAICSDKPATSTVLTDAGVSNVYHALVTLQHLRADGTWEVLDAGTVAASAAAAMPVPAVVKAVEGSGGREVELARDAEQLRLLLRARLGSDGRAAVSPFVEIRREVRFVLLDGDVLVAVDKVRGHDWRHNLDTGAVGVELVEPPVEAAGVALAAARAVGLQLATVDVVEVDGGWSVLEMNRGTKLVKWAAQSPGEHERVVEVYRRIVAAMFA